MHYGIGTDSRRGAMSGTERTLFIESFPGGDERKKREDSKKVASTIMNY